MPDFRRLDIKIRGKGCTWLYQAPVSPVFSEMKYAIAEGTVQDPDNILKASAMTLYRTF